MSLASRIDAYILGNAGAENVFCEHHETWWNEAKHFDCPKCEARREQAEYLWRERKKKREAKDEK